LEKTTSFSFNRQYDGMLGRALNFMGFFLYARKLP